MSRPKGWEKAARELQISLIAMFGSIQDITEETLIASGNEPPRGNRGLFNKKMLEIDRVAAGGKSLAQEVLALIEDNDKNKKDWDLDFAARQEERANQHRRGE